MQGVSSRGFVRQWPRLMSYAETTILVDKSKDRRPSVCTVVQMRARYLNDPACTLDGAGSDTWIPMTRSTDRV